ncbi:glycosyltransferase [Maricaulaceae bacterium NA33B04]|nr:glycosyltransferase [Maricaulaceae bacterium NA33B04]
MPRNLTLPTISIVTPNYNGADYLQVALTSILDQDVTGLEYVVVDGGSTDGSAAIINQFSSRLSKTIIEPDDGHADALNKGFAQTSGDIMGWLNSDDMLFNGSLAFVQRLFAAYPEIEWVTGRASSMNAAGEVTHIQPARPWSRLRMLCGDTAFIQQESTFWRRSLWERSGARLETDFSLANDFELWMRFFREAELHTADRHLGCFRIRPGQRSVAAAAQYQAEARQVLARELDRLEPGYRTAFADVLPIKPRQPEPSSRDDDRAALAACDPPILKPSAVNRRYHQARWSAAQTRSEPAAAASMFDPSDLSAFRDKHAGERCFIMGNGPSLNQTDLSLLKNETVFGCNGIFLLFDRIDWRPAYYACVDSRVLPGWSEEIGAMLAAQPEMTGFFPVRLSDHAGGEAPRPTRSLIDDQANVRFFNERSTTMANLPWSMFSPDPGAYLIQPHTVTITMLQLAAYMGFSEIFLIGCDNAYKLTETVEHDGGETSRARVGLTSTRDDDPNHFDPRYFGSGRRWHVPNLHAMVTQYEQARAALEAKGVRVFNATVGGELEVFDRIALEEAVARPRKTARAPRAKRAAIAAPAPTAPAAGLRTTIENNRGVIIAGAAYALLAALLVAAAPGAAASLAMAACAVATASLGLAGLLALKTRRIILGLLKRVEAGEREAARREITLTELSAQVDELEFQRDEARRSAGDRPLDDGPQSHPDP